LKPDPKSRIYNSENRGRFPLSGYPPSEDIFLYWALLLSEGMRMQGAIVKNPSTSKRGMKKPGKEELRSNLKGLISEIAMHKVDGHVEKNNKLKRITSLEIAIISTDSAHKKKPSIDEIIAEMEAEIERLG
jgi:hypothetical protein